MNRFLLSALLGGASAFALSANANGLPSGGHYVSGKGEIGKAGQSLTVKQSSTTGIVDWNKFSVGAKSSVTFDNGSGATLNRVTGGNLSTIAGSLHATGSLYLMNNAGVIVSGTGRVVTGGNFMATTSNSAFGDDDRRFKIGTGKVTNKGTIISGGTASLSGSNVTDTGTIHAARVNLQASHKLAIGGDISAQNSDGSGGTIIATGRHIGVGSHASLTASGTKGGTVLIGGDIHGGSIAADNFVKQSVRTAQSTTIAAGAHISADGSHSAGGNIVIWSDGRTSFAGSVSAKGKTGGGFAEVSSHDLLGFTGTANLTSVSGKSGSLLLDPEDVLLSNDPSSTATLSGDTFSPGGDNSIINIAILEGLLSTADVTVTTGSGGAQEGNISVINPITWSSSHTLKLDSYHSIVIGAPITVKGSGDLTFVTNDGGMNGRLTFVNGLGSLKFSNLSSDLEINGDDYTLVNNISALAGDIAATPAGFYALASNITAPTTTYTSSPIPTTFTGTFEGLGNTITGLKVNDPTGSAVGLFSDIGGAGVVADLSIQSPTVTEGAVNDYVGALAGTNEGTIVNVRGAGGTVIGAPDASAGGLVGENFGTINDSSSSATVSSGETGEQGGLVGVNASGTIFRSYATGNVTGGDANSYTGGLVGANSGIVSSSYATGKVTSGTNANVGGLVGNNDATINYSYATGATKATSGGSVGGLVGNNVNGGSISFAYALGTAAGGGSGYVGGLVGVNEGSIDQAYSTGAVSSTGSGDAIGGFAGINSNTITNSYYATDTSGQGATGIGTETGTAGVTGLLRSAMFTASNMPDLTFGTTPGSPGFVIADLNTSFNNASGAAGGTLPLLLQEASDDTDVHLLNNMHQMELIGLDNGGTYFLANSINAAATAANADVWSSVTGFVPAGGTSYLTGELYGLGRTVSNLYIKNPTADYTGLIDWIYGRVEGISVTDANVFGIYCVGVLSGGTGSGAINAVVGDVVSGSVTATGASTAYLGGLLGFSTGAISSSHSSVTVTSMSGSGGIYIGGLVGEVTGGSIDSSYATGSVSGSAAGTDDVGGLLGYSSGTISNSWASGNVSGANGSDVGGFLGVNAGAIITSYATGNATGATGPVGGFVGYNESSSKPITESYATGNATGGAGSDVGGFVGHNHSGHIEESFSSGAAKGGNSSNVGGFAGYNSDQLTEDYSLGSVVAAQPTDAGGFVGSNDGSIDGAYATGWVNVTSAGSSGGFGGANAGTVTNTYFDTETTGQSTGIGTGSTAGVTGKTTAQLQAALPTGFDPADWKIVAGKSFAYLDWQAPSGTPEVISGTVSGTGNAGIGVGVLVNGQSATPLASMASGANGYYYELLTPGTITSSGSDVVVYKKTGSHANVFDLGAKGSLTGLNLAPNTLTVDSAAASSSAMLSAMNTAVGSFANSNYLYTAAGSFTSGIDLDLDLSAASFNINSAIDLGTGELVLDAAGKVSQGSASTITAAKLTGSSDGEVLLNSTTNLINNLAAFTTGSNTLELTDDRTLTVDGLVDAGSVGVHLTTVGAGHNIVLDNKIHADDLYLVSSGAVSESGTGDINVAKVLGSSVGTAQMTSALNVIGALGTFTSGSTFQIASDRSLAVEGVVNAGTAGAHVTTVGAGHAIVVDAKIAAGDVYLVSSGTIKEAATGDIDAVKLLGSSVNATSLNSSLNTITDLGAFSTNGTAAFELTDDHGLTVDGAVSAGTGTLDLTTVGAGHNLAINANITGGTINLVTTGSASEASTAAIAAAKLNVTANTGINLTSTHNAITKLGTDKTNTGQNKVTL